LKALEITPLENRRLKVIIVEKEYSEPFWILEPLGIEGIKLNDDMREIAPGIFGIGALTIGKLKYKVERGILEEARRNGGKGNVYSYDYAMDLARKILRGKLSAARLAVTISYPSNSLLK